MKYRGKMIIIQLLKNQTVYFGKRPPGTFEKKLSFDVDNIRRVAQLAAELDYLEDGEEEENVALVNKLIGRVKLHASVNQEVNVAFEIINLDSRNNNDCIGVTISSTLFSELQCILHFGDIRQHLDLALAVSFDLSDRYLPPITASNLRPVEQPSTGHTQTKNSSAQNTINHNKYRDLEVKAAVNYFHPHLGKNIMWKATLDLVLKVDINDYIPADGLLSGVLRVNRSIATNPLNLSDAKIRTKSGTEIPAKTIFLTASSSFFATLLSNRPAKHKPRINMQETSEEGVNTLLEYLYFHVLTKPKRNPKIALELFKAAVTYCIEDLSHLLMTMFINKSSRWYDLDTALYLYLFVEQNELQERFPGADVLIVKIFQVVKRNKDKLHVSALFLDERFKEGNVMMDLFKMALTDTRHADNGECSQSSSKRFRPCPSSSPPIFGAL